MERVKNKNLYIGYITAGFIFLFFPSLSIFDIMPDFIGYLLIIKGTVCLFDLNEDINSARSSFIKLFFINLAKTVLTPLLMSLNDETTTMTAVFIFSIIEGILLYSALDSLFVGVNYVAERADSKFADKGYSDVKITTAIFVIGRFVLVSLPELTVMTSLDYQMTDDLSAFTVYDFKLLITIACFVISLILGLHFLSNAVKYIGRLKRDEVFKGYVYSRYVEEVLENKSLFIRRNTKNACTFILAGFILSCPLYFEGVDITPSPLAVLLLYMGISRLSLLGGIGEKFKKMLLAFIPVSCALYAFVCFVGAEYHRWSYQIEDMARFMYKLWGTAQCADLLVFTTSSVIAFKVLASLISCYGTNKTINKEGFQYKEQTKNVTFLNKLLICCRAVCTLAFAIRCVFFFMYPSYEFIWLFSLLLTIIYTVFFGSVISKIRTAVEDNNM